MKAKITKRTVDTLRPGESVADAEVRGFVVRRLPSGTVTYGYRYRTKGAGEQRWLPLGLHGQITPDQARELAKKRAGEVADARDPVAERASKRAMTANTLDAVLDTFLDRHVRKNLSSAAEVERALRVYIRPVLGARSIYDLRRRDIVDLLDSIEDNNGPVQADRVLAYLRKAFNWQATRDDRFTPPIVKGMARTKPKERARTRTLDDQEIRDVWAALDEARVPACYPAFVRTLLLSAQRLREVSRVRAEEIVGDVWVIGAGKYKTKIEHAVPLVAAARNLIDAELLRGQPKGARPRKTGFVFSSDGGERSFSGFSKSKAALDAAIAALRKRNGRRPMDAWSHHDLRRSARSLLSRAGVSSDHAERVLGHVIPGVRGVYDRHTFLSEKTHALEALAALVERILHPTDAVVKFPKRPRRKAR
jgi:integrase-like protein/Arm domain-containing DNA-binding protein